MQVARRLAEAARGSRKARPETHVVRARVEPHLLSRVAALDGVEGIFTDPEISGYHVCMDDPPVGTSVEAARALGVSFLELEGMTGDGVDVAVVDGGINLDHLRVRGRYGILDGSRSWTPAGIQFEPGAHPLTAVTRHGTMCAYAVGIAAPQATLLDHALLLSPAADLDALLSDAILAYRSLVDLLKRPSELQRPLVVTNSWGLKHPDQDDDMNEMGRYRDRRDHPFNDLVRELEDVGADIVFAAGNAGRPCPHYSWPSGEPMIVGANALRSVVCVGGVDLSGQRVGYSGQGPGAIVAQKPDVMAYTHFLGSEAFGPGKPDNGTSTAAPVAAGVVAAIRSRVSAAQVSPSQMRKLLRSSARRPTPVRHDNDYGAGMIDPVRLLALLASRQDPIARRGQP